MKSAQVEQEKKHESQVTFPYTIQDPSGAKHKITGDNHTITMSWGNQGLITYDTENRIWRYDYNNKPFDKAKKIKPRSRIRGIGFWNFRD